MWVTASASFVKKNCTSTNDDDDDGNDDCNSDFQMINV